MARTRIRKRWLPLLAIASVTLSAAAPLRSHPAPVTLVAIPWGTATIDGGDRFDIPATVLLEPGEYRVRVERQGYITAETTIVVRGGAPQNHLIRLERR